MSFMVSRTLCELADRRLRVKDLARIHLLECGARIWAVSPSKHKVLIKSFVALYWGTPLNQNPNLLIRLNKFCSSFW